MRIVSDLKDCDCLKLTPQQHGWSEANWVSQRSGVRYHSMTAQA